MRKIIIIGECTLDLLFPSADTLSDAMNVTAVPGGRLLNAAALLGDAGCDVTFVGDAANDPIGDFLVSFLGRHGVNTDSIDRFTDGITATNMLFQASDTLCVRDYPSQRFDVMWPRIEADDIVVFGTFFAVDARVRSQLLDLLSYAGERKAIIVYLPGLLPKQTVRITSVMPSIYENLELTQLIISRSADLVPIFGKKSPQEVFKSTFEFYCPLMVDIDADNSRLTFFRSRTTEERPISGIDSSLHGGAAAVAGVVQALISLGITRQILETLTPETAAAFASEAAAATSAFLHRQ
ncbi:MAG: hypothetical protein HDS02_04505 [Bacteroides sp.]|nr:hypothetical protein [Bacteroides sp.]MBD5330412.1 hypothetical protein [Bacteroides sp.]MBD5376259.1 hypothetical protein [Bacteroides sp.]MDE7461500.1 hypothetical protein [Paramuribaculum sp.]